MRIGWKQYIKHKLRRKSDYASVGIAFTADQVLLCAIAKRKNSLVWEIDASFSHQSWQQSLPEFVSKNGLAGASCHFALSSQWYRIHQIDRPNVADDELFNALQWPLQEASGTDKPLVYDYLDMPVQVAGQNKVFAIAVVKEQIEKVTQVLFDAQLHLKSISVEELVTTNLVTVENEPVITLVQEHGEVVVLNIVKDNILYFSRRLKGFENIGGFSESELKMGITDSICVQIQRSIDFFESQLRQAPVRKILLKLDSPYIPFLCEQIAESMGVSCEAFVPNIECVEPLNFKMASFSCLGAAYTGLVHESSAAKGSDMKKTAEVQDEVSNEVAN